MKKSFLSIFIVLLLYNTLLLPNASITFAALSPGTYTIKDITAHDSNIHPQTRDEVIKYVESNGDMPGRTGWSAYLQVCVNDEVTGEIWRRGPEINTSDSGRDKHYRVAEYRSEIIAAYGPDMYDAALKSGMTLQYQEGSKTPDPNGRLWQWFPCKTGEIGGYYNNLDFSLTLTFEVKEGVPVPNPDPNPTPGGSCSLDVNINPTGDMTSTIAQKTADPNGEITESHESSQFDVLEYGIPSSEYLKVWGQSEKYLTDYRYVNVTGDINYTINVQKQYHLKWKTEHSYETSYEDEDGETIYETHYYDVDHEEMIEKEMDFEDPYSLSYWQIGHLNVYYFDIAKFRNYALPGEEVIVANKVHATASSNHSQLIEDHVFFKDCTDIDLGTAVIDGGYSKPSVPDESGLFKDAAELTTRTPDVKNDMTEVEGFVSMDDTLVPGIPGVTHVEGPTPEHVPLASQVPVEESSLKIDAKKVNKWSTQSAVSANYKLIDGATVEP